MLGLGKVTHQMHAITWMLFVSVKTLPMQRCPEKCRCNGLILECHRQMPNFIPEHVTNVVVYGTDLGMLDFNDSGWLNVTHLTINPGESVLLTREDISVELQDSVFRTLVNLEYLQIACRCLKHISEGAFRGLSKLMVLDLSNNRITRDSFLNGLKGDGILPNLEELLFSNTSVTDFGVFIIQEDFLRAVSQKPLKVLDMSRTKFVFPQTDFFESFSHLEKLNISESSSAVAFLFRVLHEGKLTFPGFPKLRSLDLSFPSDLDQMFRPGQESRGIPFSSQLTEIYCLKFLTLPVKILYTTGISVPGYHQNETFCFSGSFRDSSSVYCIVGNINLEKLVVSENLFSYFDPDIFKHMSSVKHLDLSKNILGDAFSEENYVNSIVAHLEQLEVFIVSDNGIHTLPAGAFENAKTLKVLDLSHNRIKSVTFRTDGLTALQYLDLRHNKIVIVDELSLQRLDKLKTQIAISIVNESAPTGIYLQENSITCSCENRKYINWSINYNESNKCLLDGVETEIDNYILGQSHFLCKKDIVIVVYSLLAVVELVVFASFLYIMLRERSAAKLRRKIMRGIQQYREKREKNRKTPVFLSFCSNDDELVMGDIAPPLENGLQKLLKTDSRCVATGYNDFRPGMPLANEIIRCVEESSVIIFFVTNAFCAKMWCRNEALIAFYENKPTILMVWEDLNLKAMPKYLYHQYKHHARVHWVQENGQRVMKPGWDELCQSVVSLFVHE